mmetsp:Transcript_2879/g.11358  ORF Transcript_2879/g.11358 Transcript_2879/m.11358 type:complete len:205 (+) Transcript_2879:129-743(+)
MPIVGCAFFMCSFTLSALRPHLAPHFGQLRICGLPRPRTFFSDTELSSSPNRAFSFAMRSRMNPSLGLVSGCAAFIPLSVSLRLARVDSIRYCATIVALRLLPSKQCTRTELAGSLSAPLMKALAPSKWTLRFSSATSLAGSLWYSKDPTCASSRSSVQFSTCVTPRAFSVCAALAARAPPRNSRFPTSLAHLVSLAWTIPAPL